MRLITRKPLYRAFPELDRFTDEQCQRFLKSANRGVLRGLIRAAVIFTLGIGLFSGTLTGMMWLSDTVIDLGDKLPVISAVIAFSMGAGFIGGLIIRDLLLRRRVRRVIDERGVCSGCGYVLLGLHVGPDLKVVCPECGAATEVDVSLGELSPPEGGGAAAAGQSAGRGGSVGVFTPRKPVRVRRRWVSPVMRRYILRGIAASAVLLVVGMGTVLIVLWRQTRADIDAAARDGFAAAEWIDLIEADDDAFPGEDLVTHLIVFGDRIRALADGAIAEFPGAAWMEWSSVPQSAKRPENSNVDWDAVQVASREVYHRVIDSGMMAEMDSVLPDAPVTRHVLSSATPPEVGKYMIGFAAQARNIARLGAARARVALERADVAEWEKALSLCIAAERAFASSPSHVNLLSTVAVENLAIGEVRQALRTQPSVEWVDAIERVEKKLPAHDLLVRSVEGERLVICGWVAYYFSNQEPSPIKNLWNEMDPEDGRDWLATGRYADNIAEVERVQRARALLVAQDPWQRTQAELAAARVRPGFRLLQHWDSDVPHEQFLDAALLERRALRVMILLERYRLDTGRYPPTIDELRSFAGGDLPLDPFTGKDFGYRRGGNTTPEAPYFLWSAGADGVDDGGVFGAPRRVSLFRATPGVDCLINVPAEE